MDLAGEIPFFQRGDASGAATVRERLGVLLPNGRGADGAAERLPDIIQAVGASTRAIPASVMGRMFGPSNSTSSPNAKTICINPTTEIRAGGPDVKARVTHSCPNVAATPTPNSKNKVLDSSTPLSCGGSIRHEANTKSVATAE